MEDRIKKTRKIASYIVNTYFICVIIYFFILRVDSSEYSILEKLVILSAPVAGIIVTASKKLYYSTIFWIIFALIVTIGLFVL